MADNYLENRYNEVFGQKKSIKKIGMTLDTLLIKNRSTRGYKNSFLVSEEVLKKIIGVNTKIASAKNAQTLRFKIVTKETGAETVLKNIKLGGMLPQLNLPLKGTEPNAFIIVCSNAQESRYIDIDLGISLQSMLLKAVEIGLNGIIICAFDKDAIKEAFNLEYNPLAILAIGKSAEKFRLEEISKDQSKKYYRDENGVHIVPKVKLEDLIIY
ncbi:MAG: nitroreductase family protein [Bacteroidales bacterium]|jgi:nitroreductase|nr:nitroreductase family protein [Bacteroidales bacterium]MBR6277397.1 nitroreductase family protein [Bacteroidales bacterium]